MPVCACACVCLRLCVPVPVCAYACVCLCMCVPVHVCACASLCVPVHVCCKGGHESSCECVHMEDFACGRLCKWKALHMCSCASTYVPILLCPRPCACMLQVCAPVQGCWVGVCRQWACCRSTIGVVLCPLIIFIPTCLCTCLMSEAICYLSSCILAPYLHAHRITACLTTYPHTCLSNNLP